MERAREQDVRQQEALLLELLQEQTELRASLEVELLRG